MEVDVTVKRTIRILGNRAVLHLDCGGGHTTSRCDGKLKELNVHTQDLTIHTHTNEYK